jgi:hypothetical protein
MLQAQLLIDNAQHEQAIALLSNWRGRDAWANYAKFNLGVALVRSGKVNDAAKILNQLGKLDPLNEELASLRDKANLALGYAYLQDRQPLAAKAPLQRVRLDGPFSNKALLGVGWADAENDNYRRALVPWMELGNRLRHGEARIDQPGRGLLSERRRGVLRGSQSDRPGNLSHREWRIPERIPGAGSPGHDRLVLDARRVLKNYRDLSYLWRNLDDWQQNVDVYRAMLDTREFAYNERLPRTRQSLAQADIDKLIARKLEFDARLNGIEENADSLALASRHEFDLWGEIIAIERNPALQADIPEAQEVRDKIRLLKGALQWDLDKQFKARLWQIRRDLQQTGEALVETSRSRRQVDETMRKEPLLYADFNQRVDGLSPKIDDLKARLEDAMDRQRAFMLGVAVDELIYDLAATATVDAGFDSQ